MYLLVDGLSRGRLTRAILFIAPRKLDHEAFRARVIRDVLKLVAHLGELGTGTVEGARDLVLLEDRAVEALLGLVPEAVQQCSVGEALDVLDEVVVVEHDVLVVEATVANVLERGGGLIEDHVVVRLGGFGEAGLELGVALLIAVLTDGDVLGLDLAELSGGNHGVRVVFEGGVSRNIPSAVNFLLA
jgi:hypothetical protein